MLRSLACDSQHFESSSRNDFVPGYRFAEHWAEKYEASVFTTCRHDLVLRMAGNTHDR